MKTTPDCSTDGFKPNSHKCKTDFFKRNIWKHIHTYTHTTESF